MPLGCATAAALAVLACLVLQLLVALQVGGFDERSRGVLLGWMVLPVLALVLVEQLLRNVQEDALWNAKPLCLGLAGIFLFDLYLFSHSVLFNSLDADALSIRGAVHALMVPLLLLSVDAAQGLDLARCVCRARRPSIRRPCCWPACTCSSFPASATTCASSAANGGGRCSWAWSSWRWWC